MNVITFITFFLNSSLFKWEWRISFKCIYSFDIFNWHGPLPSKLYLTISFRILKQNPIWSIDDEWYNELRIRNGRFIIHVITINPFIVHKNIFNYMNRDIICSSEIWNLRICWRGFNVDMPPRRNTYLSSNLESTCLRVTTFMRIWRLKIGFMRTPTWRIKVGIVIIFKEYTE